MVALTDSHAHLADPAFDADRADVLARARQAGVTNVVTVGETLDDARKILELAAQFPEIRPAAGLYPTHLDLEEASRLEAWIREHRERLVAIGEVGLDYWKVQDPAGLEIQREIFRRFVRLAIELDLPLNVHSRSAGAPTIALLLEQGARRVQLHAFDGRAVTAGPAVDAGFFFSVPPSIAHAPQKRKLFRRLPLSCILLETDSPVMGPARGVRNEPAGLLQVLDGLAELKELPREAVAEAAAENTRRLYGS